MLKNKVFFILPFVLLMFIIMHASANEDFPTIFEYRFPEVRPIKIYSGPVTFEHKKHFIDYKIGCVRCHHDIEPGEMQVDNNCRDCHDEEGFPRFEDAAKLSEEEKSGYYLIALHSLCIECHIDTKLKNRKTKPPVSCTRCHLVKTR